MKIFKYILLLIFVFMFVFVGYVAWHINYYGFISSSSSFTVYLGINNNNQLSELWHLYASHRDLTTHHDETVAMYIRMNEQIFDITQDVLKEGSEYISPRVDVHFFYPIKSDGYGAFLTYVDMGYDPFPDGRFLIYRKDGYSSYLDVEKSMTGVERHNIHKWLASFSRIENDGIYLHRYEENNGLTIIALTEEGITSRTVCMDRVLEKIKLSKEEVDLRTYIQLKSTVISGEDMFLLIVLNEEELNRGYIIKVTPDRKAQYIDMFSFRDGTVYGELYLNESDGLILRIPSDIRLIKYPENIRVYTYELKEQFSYNQLLSSYEFTPVKNARKIIRKTVKKYQKTWPFPRSYYVHLKIPGIFDNYKTVNKRPF